MSNPSVGDTPASGDTRAVFVARDHELGEIEAALRRAQTTAGALYLVSGEPGIGKSRLCGEAAEVARKLGVTVVWGRCWEGRGAPPFWPWIEVFETLGRAFPSALSVAGSAPADARFAMFRQVVRSLGQVTRDTPLLLVLEDLHAADVASLELLELVASQAQTLRALVMGTFRDLEARLREDGREPIARACRLGRVLELPRLGSGDVATLVRAAIQGADDALVASIFETTQGNPLFVDEVVREFRARSHVRMPLGVREVIRERVSLVSAEVREALEAGAVLGVEFLESDVVRMLPKAQALLDIAKEHGLVVARDGRLRFSHALHREALYHDLERDRRQLLHREAARTMSHALPSALAHHLLEAGPDALPEAIDQTVHAAAIAIDTFAFEDALALLTRAWAALPAGHVSGLMRCRLLISIGEAKLRSGNPSGKEACIEAAELARALDDPTLLGLAGLAYGAVFFTGGVDPVLVGLLEEALGSMPPADSGLRARIMARLAAARQPSPPKDRPADLKLALDAIAMARRVPDRRDRLSVLHAASGALYSAVDPVVRMGISREQEELAAEVGDVTRLLQARVRLAIDYLELSDLSSYSALTDRYETLAQEIGPSAAPWRVPLMRSALALAADRFEDSERWQAEARRLAGDDPRARRGVAFHRIGFLRAAERHDELRAALDELRGLWLAMPYGTMLADARVASCLARVGDEEELRAVLARMPEDAVDEEINTTSLVDALWVTADKGLAERLLPLMEQTGDRRVMYWFDCEIVDAPNARSLAVALAVLGRWDDCERHFAHALGMALRTGSRALAARMRFELGDLFLRLGHDLGRAAELIESALRDARAIGVDELVALIQRRHPTLADLGRSPSSPPRDTTPSRNTTTFEMALEGEYYAVTGSGSGTLRFKASRGMRYVALLVERPNIDVHVLELAGLTEGVDRGDAGDLLDGAALAAYRARLSALRDLLETAEELGDAVGAGRARGEMEAIAEELARTTQKGGKSRRTASAVERARSAVQRRIKDAIARIAERDGALGAWLRQSITTGIYCKFSPGAAIERSVRNS
ncbi:MAG: hypothetical protein AMXMBFR56_35630 [Polyangiaceae bacterium]